MSKSKLLKRQKVPYRITNAGHLQLIISTAFMACVNFHLRLTEISFLICKAEPVQNRHMINVMEEL